MTSKQAAFQTWAEGFMRAYPESAVPSGERPPYLTYSLPLGAFGEETSCTVNVYMPTESEAEINAKAGEICMAVGRGGKCLLCEGGCMWVKAGSPLCQPVKDETGIKRRLINLTIEHITF